MSMLPTMSPAMNAPEIAAAVDRLEGEIARGTATSAAIAGDSRRPHPPAGDGAARTKPTIRPTAALEARLRTNDTSRCTDDAR